MMDINLRLNNIIQDCSLFKNRFMAERKMYQYFCDFQSKIAKMGECIVVGETSVADRFMKCVSSDNFLAIADPAISGNNVNGSTKQIRGVKVLSLSDAIKDTEDATFILLGNNINKDIYNTVISNSASLFSVYDDIELVGKDVLAEYNEWIIPYVTEYERIMFLRRKFETAKSDSAQKRYLEGLIYKFISVKDFISAFNYIELFCKKGFDIEGGIEKLKNEIGDLLKDIKNELSLRSSYHDILMIWNDGLRYDEFTEMQYLGKEMASKCLVFHNAYTTVYDTRGAIAAIFNKRYQIDDFYHSEDDCDIENSLLMKKLKDKGYVLKGRFGKNLSNKKDTTDMDLYDLGSRKIWDGMRELLLSDSPVFLFIHELSETHNPYHNPYLVRDYYYIRECEASDYKSQIDSSRNFWDRQLRFYMQLLDYNNYKIFMSDHGKPLDLEELCVAQKGYKQEYIHTMLMISGEGIEHRACNHIFSLVNFCELIEYMINPSKENYEWMFKGYALMQAVDRYNPGDIKRKLMDGTEKRSLMSYRAIRTNKDMFVRYRDGKMFYYLLPDLDTDRSNDPEFKERIDQLMEQNGDYFLDIYSIPFFEASRILYE